MKNYPIDTLPNWINRAEMEAQLLGHSIVTTEHLFLSCMRTTDDHLNIKGYAVSIESFTENLKYYLGGPQTNPHPRGLSASLKRILFEVYILSFDTKIKSYDIMRHCLSKDCLVRRMILTQVDLESVLTWVNQDI